MFVRSFGGGGAFSKISAGATFCIHHFSVGRKAARQTERHAGSIGGDTGAVAGAKKLNATKSRDKRRNPLRREEMSTAALMSDILMVSDLIETPAPLFIPSL